MLRDRDDEAHSGGMTRWTTRTMQLELDKGEESSDHVVCTGTERGDVGLPGDIAAAVAGR